MIAVTATTILIQLEGVIEAAERASLESGRALQRIRDERMYKPAYSSFEDYLEARWHFSRQHAARLISAAEVAGRLSPMGDSGLKERHLRAVAKLPPDRQPQAVERFLALPKAEQKTTAMEEIVKAVALRAVNTSEDAPDSGQEDSGHRSPICWYGGKYKLRRQILALMPPHNLYVEPFFGGGSVLFSKQPSRVEIVSDVNHGVVTFFSVLRDPKTAAELQRRLKLTPYSRDEHRRCLDPKPTGDPIDDARRFFVRVRQSYSSIEQGHWALCVKKTQPRATDAANVVDRLLEVGERLRKVQIESKSFEHMLPKCDVTDAFIYCDPTYTNDTRTGHGGYLHEMDESAHIRLLDILTRKRHAKVMISGYHSPLYDERLKGWTVYEFPITVDASGVHGSAKAKRTEVLWRNWK